MSNILHRLGYSLIPNWRVQHYRFAYHLRRLFALVNVDLVLDVGANGGQFRDFLRHEVGYKGMILSFEPIPSLVDELRRRAAADPLWHIEGVALGRIAGMARFNEMTNSQFSSFLEPGHSPAGSFCGANQVREHRG